MIKKISVAMATYNGAKFIEEQLDSILNQTLPVDEIVICDDISSDNTAEVITKYISDKKLQNKIHFTVNDKNLGYASNFVQALRKTTGDCIFFCDQDDIWISDRVEKMVKVLENNTEICLLGSEFEPFKCDKDAPNPHKWELKKFRNDDSIEKLLFNSENIFIGCQGCTMVMTRDFINRVIDFWYEGWAHDEFAWKMALSEESLYFYHRKTIRRRLHSNNVTLHKEHDKGKRLKYLSDLEKSHKQTIVFLDHLYRKNKISQQEYKRKTTLLNKHIRATQMREDLIGRKKIFNSIKLLGFLDCYHKKRAVPVELLMVLK